MESGIVKWQRLEQMMDAEIGVMKLLIVITNLSSQF